jgi:putative ABC transport system permease protein
MTLKHFLARAIALFRSERIDRDFAAEVEAHLAMMVDDYKRRGMTLEQAQRAARVRLGGVSSLQQQHRDSRGFAAVEGLLQDVRFSLRMIAKERWVSAAVVTTLALGIGANTLGFAVVNAAFLRALPFEEPDRLYTLTWRTQAGRRTDVSYQELQDWRAQTQTFAGLAAFADATVNVSDDHAFPERVRAALVTADVFSSLRQPPLIGRDFVRGEDERGADPVVILGYDLWRNRYRADAAVLGKTLRVNGQPATIVGVMPSGMKFPDNQDLWVPFSPSESTARRDVRPLTVFGRLKPGIDVRQSQAEMNAVARQLGAAYPELNADFVGINVETFSEAYIGGMGRRLFITIMVAVTFVLLIACGNVANLLLARSRLRAREIALRMAIGAPRWRVLRQLLVESVVLALIGGAAGLFLADMGTAAFARGMDNVGLPYWVRFTTDYAVFAYVAGLCLVTAVVFGLAPAVHVSKANNHEVLKESGRGSFGSRRARRFSSAMVVTELALSTVLLAGAVFMSRSFFALYSIDLGLDVDRLMTMRLELPAESYPDAARRQAFFAQIESRIASVPGVESVAVTTGVPPSDGGERLLEVDRGGRGSGQPRFVSTVAISPRFFETLERPLVRGRNFTEADGAPGSETAIINDELAAQFFAGEDPIGRRVRFTQRQPRPGDTPEAWRTIVGISSPILHGSPQDSYFNSVIYVPYRQDSPSAASLVIRTALPPASLMDAVRREVQALDADQPVFTTQTLRQTLAADRWAYRTFGSLFVILAVIAVVLSTVGLYAVMSYFVTQRTQEIGVRIAVGAERSDVSWLVLRRGLIQLAIGLPFGLAGALALGVILESMLVGMTPGDPLTFTVITLTSILVAVAACLLPARNAMRVDPMVALRAE